MKYCPSFMVNHLKMAGSIPGSKGHIKTGSRPDLAVGQSLPIPVLGGKSYTCSVFQSQRRPQASAMQPQQSRASPHRGTGACHRDEAGCPEPFALAASPRNSTKFCSGSFQANIQSSFTCHPKSSVSGTQEPGLWTGNANR